MKIKYVVITLFTLLVAVSAFSADVTFNDENLLEAVRLAYEDQVGVPLSEPPQDTELANTQFQLLDASNLDVTDLTGLEYCTSLIALNLIGNQITDVSPIGNLTNLQILFLGKNQISDISSLSGLSGNLIYLDIGYNQIDDISTLSTFTNLKALNLGFGLYGLYPEGVNFSVTGVNNLDDTDLNILTNLTSLIMLSIGGLENVTSINFLNSLNNLTQLYLGNNPISDWSPLGAVEGNLNVFAEFNCGLNQNAVNNYVKDMTNIKLIDEDNPGILAIVEFLESTDITDISGLNNLNPSLAFLGGININNIDVVSNWTYLTDFVCALTGITNLNALIGLPNLSTVSAPLNQIGPTMFTQPISTPFNNLTELDISENLLENLSGIEYMPNLVSLIVNNNMIDDIWVMESDGTPKNTLKVLDLSNNRIQEINPLLNYVNLDEVNLSNNQIENFGYLEDNSGIGPGDVLDISYNPVPPQYCSIVDSLAVKVLPGGSLNREGVCQASIEVEIVGEGVTDPPVGINPYSYNISVPISAYPLVNSSYAFKQWEIFDNDLGNYVFLTDQSSYWFTNLTKNIKVRAVFVNNEPTYKITFNLQGNGSVNEFKQGSGDYNYLAGRQINLYVFTGPGAYFAGWTGDIAELGTQLYANVVMDGDKVIGAIFENTGFTITTGLDPEIAGGVYPFPNTYYFASEVQVTLSAWSNPGYRFVRWEDDAQNVLGSDNPITVTMDSDKVYIAIFETVNTFRLFISVNPLEAGTTFPSPGEHAIEENQTVTIYATPNTGWFFKEWTGDIGSAYPYNNSIDIFMDRPKDITANFVPADLTLQLYIEGEEYGQINPPAGTYYYQAGNWVFLNAENYSPYAFLGWHDLDSLELITLDKFYAFQVEEGMGTKRIVGRFGNATYLVELLDVAGGGTTNPPSPGTYGFVNGQTCVLVATPDPGYKFKNWVDGSGNFVSEMNPLVIEFIPTQQNYTYRAVFEECDWNVNFATAGTGTGNTIPPLGAQCYKDRETIFIQAIPDEGSYFGGWQIIKNPGPNQEESWEYWVTAQLTVDTNYDLIAWFENSGYTLDLSSEPNGYIYPYPGRYYLAEGFPAWVYAQPNQGYVFLGWYNENNDLVSPELYYEFVLNEDTVLIARYSEITYKTLTLSVISGIGTTGPVPNIPHQYVTGTEVEVVAVPAQGWIFASWTGDLEGVQNINQPTIIVPMDRNRNIGVIFVEQPPEGEGTPEGTIEGEGTPEGVIEGEGTPEGVVEGEGEGSVPPTHSADQDGDGKINLSELLRVIQFFNFGSYHCDPQGEDGYAPGPGDQNCVPHASDYNPQDWVISLSELLRVIQFFNIGGYYPCEGGEDGYCPGQQP